jgi:hypothetical protein
MRGTRRRRTLRWLAAGVVLVLAGLLALGLVLKRMVSRGRIEAALSSALGRPQKGRERARCAPTPCPWRFLSAASIWPAAGSPCRTGAPARRP